MSATPSSEVVPAAPSISEAPAVASASRGRRLVEWFWRGRTLAEATSRDDATAKPEFVASAEEAIEVADRLSARIDPPRSGSGLGPALMLYREALSACLLS